MAFLPIQLPTDTPPVFQGLVRGALEPFLGDAHAMLRFPADDAVAEMLARARADFEDYPVSTRLNATKADDAELVTPLQ